MGPDALNFVFWMLSFKPALSLSSLWSSRGSLVPPPFLPLVSSAYLCLVAQSCLTICNPMDSSPPGSSVHGDSPGKNTGVGCHALLQGIFRIQRLNPGLPLCMQILCHLSHQGSSCISEIIDISPGMSLLVSLTKYDPLEKIMAIYFSILALRTPWKAWKAWKEVT